ncbi:MAG: metallophosphoesterase [Verrucomicrobia bacterium]|nr:metallophosphoesterase [Verrucomicrobiota bacterium]
MKHLGLIHLSDIHCRRTNDFLARAFGCIHNLTKDPDLTKIEKFIIVLTGDLAYSGKKEEYLEFAKLLSNLRISLGTKYWKTVAIPGNHDCDFEKPQTVRNMVLRQIPSESEPIYQQDLVSTCTTVQEEFFLFLKDNCDIEIQNNKLRLYWECHLEADGKKIIFECYNSSWTSQLNEKPGTLAFPRSLLKELDETELVDLRVGLIHHPTNWITPMRRRALDSHLERTCDIVLSGHEHLIKASAILDFSGHITNHIQAGVFHEKPGDSPGDFSIIEANLETKEFRVIECQAQPTKGHVEIVRPLPAFLPFRRDRSRIAHGYQISPEFEAFISNPGIAYTHPSGRTVTLEDVFVMPDFRSAARTTDDDTINFLPGERIEQLARQQKYICILGGELAGKTTIGKKLFVGFIQHGLLPVWLDGSEITNNTSGDVSKLIRAGISRCYSNAEFDHFIQANEGVEKVLIVDDFHKAKINLTAKNALLNQIEEAFSVVILLADSSLGLSELTLGKLDSDFRQRYEQLDICEFGPSRRRALAERWILLGNEKTITVEELNREVEEAEKVFLLLRGDSYFPALPFFLLSILQTKDSASLRDGVGRYGYHYESLINDALLSSLGRVSEDDRRNYLSLFAFELFKDNSQALTERRWELLHRQFQTLYKKSVSKSELEKILLGSKLVTREEGSWRFKYPYVFYFFVARYFRERLRDPAIFETIQSLSANLHTETATNVWMFLVHQSRDPLLLEILIKRATDLLPHAPEAMMDDDLSFFSKIGAKDAELDPFVIDGPDLKKARLRDEDEKEAKNAGREKAIGRNDAESADVLKEVESSLKTVQVLGQMLKNFSYEGEAKTQLVREGGLLALRFLGFFLSALDQQHNEIVEFISKRLERSNPGSQTYEQVRQEVTRNLVRIARINIFGILRFAAVALGSKDEDEIYEEFTKERKSNASALLGMAIKLETAQLPIGDISSLARKLNGSYISESTLKLLVIHHCYVFEPKISELQSVCSVLGLKAKVLETNRAIKALRTQG